MWILISQSLIWISETEYIKKEFKEIAMFHLFYGLPDVYFFVVSKNAHSDSIKQETNIWIYIKWLDQFNIRIKYGKIDSISTTLAQYYLWS